MINEYTNQCFIVAVGEHDTATIVEARGDFVTQDVMNVSPHLEDLGIDCPKEWGLYKWEGKVIADEEDVQYYGEFKMIYHWEPLK